MVMREECAKRVKTVWKKVGDCAAKQGHAALNEEFTKALLVTPMLEALGWMENLSDIELEWPIPKTNEKADYIVKNEGIPFALVEAKRFRDPLTDDKRRQLIQYGAVSGIGIGILTNGIQFEVHDLTYHGPLGGGLVFTSTLDVPEEGLAEQLKKLWLLSREAASRGELDDYLKRSKAFAEVRQALQDNDSPLQKTMRSMMKKFLGRKATVDEVQEALRQALSQIQAAHPVAEPTEIPLPQKWQEDQLRAYIQSNKQRVPLEYGYYYVLSKSQESIDLQQLSSAMSEHMGRPIDGRNIRGMLGGITVRLERKMKKERLDVREHGTFGLNADYRDLLMKCF